MQKEILKSDHYQFVITDEFTGEGQYITKIKQVYNPDGKTQTIYLNSEYYNTKKALANGIASAVFRSAAEEILGIALDNNLSDPEESIDKYAFLKGEELIELLKQL